jgi:hypothetical protein
MGQNFDDYPGFQQTPGMLILLQHSVHICSVCTKYGKCLLGGNPVLALNFQRVKFFH